MSLSPYGKTPPLDTKSSVISPRFSFLGACNDIIRSISLYGQGNSPHIPKNFRSLSTWDLSSFISAPKSGANPKETCKPAFLNKSGTKEPKSSKYLKTGHSEILLAKLRKFSRSSCSGRLTRLPRIKVPGARNRTKALRLGFLGSLRLG